MSAPTVVMHRPPLKRVETGLKPRPIEPLTIEGRRLHALGNLVVFLYPSQEWMAVQLQVPFLRSEPLPLT